MFGARLAQEAKDISIENRTALTGHMTTCIENQHRIENRFTGVENKLERQDQISLKYREEQSKRLGDILEIGRKRYMLTMGAVVPTFIMMAFELAMKYFGK